MKKNNFFKSKKKNNFDEISVTNKLFCSECEIELEEYDIPNDTEMVKSIKKRHFKCVKEGRFKGELCARLFIASNELDNYPFDHSSDNDF